MSYEYDKIKPAPVRTDDKDIERAIDDIRRALEQVYKIIDELISDKADA